MTPPQDAGSVLESASLHTCQVNAAQAARPGFSDESCFDEAQRGFVGSIPDARITTPDGRSVDATRNGMGRSTARWSLSVPRPIPLRVLHLEL